MERDDYTTQDNNSGNGGSNQSSQSNNPFGYNSDQWNQANSLYSSLLGRQGSANEVATHFVNGSLDPNAYQNIYNSPEAAAYRQSQATPPAPSGGTPTPPAPPDPKTSSGMPAGIDPRLSALYTQYGMTPGGSGSGFADWQYWQDKANSSGDWNYFLNRLGADLSGKGTDNPEGTPGSGGWSTSGSGATQGPPQFAGGTIGNLLNGGGLSVGGSTITPTFDPEQIKNFISSMPAPQYQMTDQDKALFDQLTAKANQSLAIDPTNDAIIKPQVDAFAAQQDRASRQYLQNAAESSGPYATGALQGQARMLAERTGQNTGALQAQLTQNELQARRAEIAGALQEMGSTLSTQDQMALQRQLGLINSALGQQQISNNYALGQGQLNLGQQQINSNNDQFAANYGLNSTNQANYWDAVRRGLI